jgi:hypothetical protein
MENKKAFTKIRFLKLKRGLLNKSTRELVNSTDTVVYFYLSDNLRGEMSEFAANIQTEIDKMLKNKKIE